MLTNEQILGLAETYGDSFYLVDVEKFRENFSKLLNAFKHHYQKTKIAYSYKTNYLPNLCIAVDQLDGYAEVVSSMEMNLARRLGILDKNIFFNGPIKNLEATRSLLENGGTVNIDSLDEFSTIISWLNAADVKNISLGIRCNFDVMEDVNSRFGLDPRSLDFTQIMKECIANPKISLTGFHCHFASRALESWSSRAYEMVKFLETVDDEVFNGLKQISLGGGMSGEMPAEMERQFKYNIPKFEEYAQAAASKFSKIIGERSKGNLPELIIEPGTALAANVVNFICSVVSIKKVRDEQIVTSSGSIYNINPTPNRINVPLTIIPKGGERDVINVSNARIVGFTCIETDCLYRNFSGEISVGDFIAMEQVGAYSIVMKPPFILPNVAIIEYERQSGHTRVIKRAETFDDIFSTYNI